MWKVPVGNTNSWIYGHFYSERAAGLLTANAYAAQRDCVPAYARGGHRQDHVHGEEDQWMKHMRTIAVERQRGVRVGSSLLTHWLRDREGKDEGP